MPSSNDDLSAQELGKEASQEDRPNHSDFVDIGYSNTDVAGSGSLGTTGDAGGQPLNEGEEGGGLRMSDRTPRGLYHNGSPTPYQDRSPGQYRTASPAGSRKDDDMGTQGSDGERISAGYGGDDMRRGSDIGTPPSEDDLLKTRADLSKHSQSSERDSVQKICPRCDLGLPTDETLESHMNICPSRSPPHLTREEDAFHFDANANHHHNNNNNNNDNNMTEELSAGNSDRPNLSHIHQLIRGLSKPPPNGLSGGPPGPNPVLDALKMKLIGSGDLNTDNKVEGHENMTSLQRAYYTLQQQQMLQVQLIQKIQAQLSLCNKEQIPENNNFPLPHPSENQRESPLIQATNDRRTPSPRNKLPSSNILSELMERFKPTSIPKQNREKTNQHPSIDPRDRPLSPSSTSGSSAPGLQNTVLQHPNPPMTAETNSLEKLQQTANHVLTKASQGIFTHHLIEDSNNSDTRDSSNKHKCRYCGKVFGSDSGLQIHLRSHTGERPFKCNICGNRFTTRGNLKVHFQRHQSRFPHVKMNHNPVPEHLDKLYPPLLAQLGELEDTPPAPTGPPNPFSPPISVPPPSPFNLSSPPPLALQQPLAASLIYRRVLEKSESESMNQRFLDIPVSRPDDGLNRSLTPPGDAHSKEDNYSAPPEKQANEDLDMGESLAERQKSLMDKMYSENSMENCNSEGGSDDINMTPKCEMSDAMDDDLSNDSSGSPNSNVGDIQANRELLGMLQRRQLEFPPAAFPGMRLPFNFPFLPGLTNMPPRPGGKPGPPLEIPGGFDVTKDPNIYTNLLPRPGSTDNSWEALIEVQKTSETMKLEQLVNNIENKLTDPNQCIICHRVLSCKSALQMHYRIHTGERPYKCKICSRTFTTKGNLKTHMSVHRARPPIRMLHQCPVCHKRYNNGMILQQHIRQHTGEPTDITNEQMAAAEVRELIPTSMHQMVLPRFPPFSPHIPGLLQLMHPLRPHLFQEGMQRDQDGKEESKDEEKDSRPFSSTLRSFAEEASENRTGSSEDGQSRLSPSRSLSPGPLDFSYSPRTQRNSEERSSRSDDKSPSRGNSPPPHSQAQDHPSSPLDLALRPPPPPLFSPFGLFPPPLTANPLSPQGQPMSFSPKNRFLPAMLNIPGQGNTTCKICFKTLSCASALEIHYRSHTKDRPFICTVCDRRFTTRGNMKQHMVTHKGHEDNLPPAPPPAEKPARSRNSSRTHSPKMSVSLPPSSSHMIPSYIQAGLSSPSSSASVLQGIPLAPALFTYPQFSHPLAALPGSIAALLGQSGIHGARTDQHKMDLLNLKREREGEIPLPMSKRLSGLGQDGEEKMSTTPPHTPPPAPDTPFQDTHSSHHRVQPREHPPSPTPARTPTSPVPSTQPVNTPHSINELLTHPPSPDDHPCHQPSTSPHTQPLLVS